MPVQPGAGTATSWDPFPQRPPTHIQDYLQSTWSHVGADVAKHAPGHLANQMAGLGQEGQEDLYQHLHPWRLLGVCKREEV